MMEDLNRILSPHQQAKDLSSLEALMAASQVALLISSILFMAVSVYALNRGFDVLPYVSDGSAFGCRPAEVQLEGAVS